MMRWASYFPFRYLFLLPVLTVVLFNLFGFQAFAKMFNSTPDDLDMQVIYDVSHNIAKFEEHYLDGKQRTLLVHRKGSTRAFPPHHPLIPVDYQLTGQPVLIGGTMGTCSYVLTGTEQGMKETFGTTCHGAVSHISVKFIKLTTLSWNIPVNCYTTKIDTPGKYQSLLEYC